MIALARLKDVLRADGCTCVLTDGRELLKSRESGIKPLLDLIASGRDVCGFSAADKIVGKAAALLYAYMGVGALYAEVLSEGGAEVCKRYGIFCEYGTLTANIINRRGDGLCPMEHAVLNVSDPAQAYAALVERFKRLQG